MITNDMTLSDISKSISKSLRLTKETRKESGFNICEGKGEDEYSVTDIEQGKTSKLSTENICSTKIQGAFHTHPNLKISNNDTIPSEKDIKTSINHNLKFFCIGGNNEEENNEDSSIIRCFDVDDLKSEVVNYTPKKITKKMLSDKDYLNKHSIIYKD